MEDISLNLEIPLDTVKSLFGDFEKENIIKIAGNQISIVDIKKLNALVEGVTS